jgi:antibiotic biosynthesis monooxygenase (ABM) superfamily enzyme
MLLFGQHLARFPVPIRTLLLTVVLVPMMVFVLLPGLQKLFAPWLRR